jgi:glycosyltransferase involved in cell wall biosynthesis
MADTKALFVSPAGGVYGSERSMLALLQAREFDAEVVCPRGGDLESALCEIGVKTCPLEFGKYSLWQNPFWHIGFYRRLQRILKISRPHVLVINLDGNTPLVTLAAVRSKIPIVRFSRFEFKPPTRWVDRWCWLNVQAVICPSELVKQQVLAWAPPKSQLRVHRLYDSYSDRTANSQEVASFRQEFRFGDDKIIGYIGRLDRRKRVETVIQALASVRQQVSNARLVVIGGAGSPDEFAYQEELAKLASSLGLREVVTFTGFRRAEQMPAAIASLDVCVLPSESESFGMVLMEAWAQSVPTVASDVGGCGEISRASGGGQIAAVGDVRTFARHLGVILSDAKTAAAMGEKGKAWVQQNCAAATYAANFFSILMTCRTGRT